VRDIYESHYSKGCFNKAKDYYIQCSLERQAITLGLLGGLLWRHSSVNIG